MSIQQTWPLPSTRSRRPHNALVRPSDRRGSTCAGPPRTRAALLWARVCRGCGGSSVRASAAPACPRLRPLPAP